MDCFIEVIKGADKGLQLTLGPGVTIIGRSAKAGFRLNGEDVSFEHAQITRSGEEYVLENLSSFGTFIDGARLTGPVKLRPRDRVQLSQETVIRLTAVGGNGLLARRGLLLGAIAAVLVLGVGYFAYDAWDSSNKPTENWRGAYQYLSHWLNDEAKDKRLPAAVVAEFDRAWRLEITGDYENATNAWLQVQGEFARLEKQRRMMEHSQANPQALQSILSPRRLGGEAQMPSDIPTLNAAAYQFVSRRLTTTSGQMKTSREKL
jgi:hypothetical protein